VDIPSGAWRGVYRQDGSNHDVCEFELTFGHVTNGDLGRVTGSGTDSVGAYSIDGKYLGQRVAFQKKYRKGSRNAEGRYNEDNEGHAVEYRGELQSLGAGLRGTWRIVFGADRFQGAFHLWPVMNGWTELEAEGVVYDVGSAECVVCFDSLIDTVLHPCGHFAVCRQCAEKLEPRHCPICRADINGFRRPRPSAPPPDLEHPSPPPTGISDPRPPAGSLWSPDV